MSQLTVDSLDDVILTADDIEMCSANVTQCTASVKVSYKNDSVFFSVGGDVPSGTDHLKFIKYCYSQANWCAQGWRENKKNKVKDGKLGHGMRRVKND